MKIIHTFILCTFIITSSAMTIAPQRKPLTNEEKKLIHDVLNRMEYSFLKDHQLHISGHHVAHKENTHKQLRMKIMDGLVTVCDIQIDGGFDEIKNCHQSKSCVDQVQKCSNLYDRESDYVDTNNYEGLKEMFKEPKEQKEIKYDGIREMFKEPKEKKDIDYTGIKELFREPKQQKETDYTGVKEMFREPKEQKDIDYTGVKELFREPKEQKDIDYTGIKEMFREPREQKDIDYTGLREMFREPKEQKDIDYTGVKELFREPKEIPEIDYKGIKEIYREPKETKEIDYTGIKELYKENKNQPEINYEGIDELYQEPEQMSHNFEGVDLSNVLINDYFKESKKTDDNQTQTEMVTKECSLEDKFNYKYTVGKMMTNGKLQFIHFYIENIAFCDITSDEKEVFVTLRRFGQDCSLNLKKIDSTWFIQDNRVREQIEYIVPGTEWGFAPSCLGEFAYPQTLKLIA